MDLSGSKVVLTGGGGFIGSHVVEELSKIRVGEIVVYDNFTRGTRGNLSNVSKNSNVTLIDGDITDVESLNRNLADADYVIHLAALWLLHCYEYPREAFEVNIKGTFNVLEACVNNDVKRLIYSSSASVYGDASFTPMEENHPFNNRTFYGATKIAGEQMCRSFYERYGLDYVGLRYMNVYGPRQDYKGAYTAVMMKMLDMIDQGKPLPVYGDGSQTYDFIYVGDIAKANIHALTSDATDSFYNVGTGIGTTIKQMAELLLEITGSNVGIDYQPAGQTFVTNRIGSTSLARIDLGFESEVDIEKGLSNLIEWRRADIESQKG